MIRLTLLIVFLATSALLIAQDAPVYNYSNWQTVKNEKLKFTVKLPSGWKFLEQKEPAIQVYFVSDKAEEGEKDISAKKFVVESKPIADDLKVIAGDMIKSIKIGDGGKSFIKEKDAKLGVLPSKEITYHFKEDGYEKTAEMVIVKFKNSFYSFTYISSSRTAIHDLPLKNQILSSINLEVMQPGATLEFKKPKDWFEFKDNEYAQAFSKKENGSNNPGEGIIKVRTVKIDEEKSLQQFTIEFVSSVTKEGAQSSGFSTTSPINGHKLMWFDVLDKEDYFKERYHIAKDGYTFYIIYFISSKELFEKELKVVLAESLLTFKLLPPK